WHGKLLYSGWSGTRGRPYLETMCGFSRSSDYLGRFAPYFDRPWRRSVTPDVSSVPRTVWYRTPGRSLTRPPRINTTECSCRLWPSPPMYDATSKPLVRRTLATLRRAEFGFFGVVVYTRVHTPRRCGQLASAGD